MDRRTFIALVTLSAFASTAQSCDTASNSQGTGGLQAIGDASSVKDPGSVLTGRLGNQPVAVVRDAKSGELGAVSLVCTHAGCTVNWQESVQQFSCPCHNSVFSATGAVLKGPATEPLKSYPVKVEGEQVFVQG